VDLGVDRTLFHPIEQAEARAKLAIAPGKTVLTYVGILDYTHDLGPAIEALLDRRDPSVELHIVGDGERRGEYGQAAAASGGAIVLHGRVPHHEVPWQIAAADICLAPYNPAAFSSGELGYSTMKIPEYLSVGRPVVSVPSGRIRSLVSAGRSGFLFDNTAQRWREFFRDLPDRERLRKMGIEAAAVKLPTWDDTARAYLDLCRHQLAARP
jgi:glycosyltransferase involved in cell wall biosynthesis